MSEIRELAFAMWTLLTLLLVVAVVYLHDKETDFLAVGVSCLTKYEGSAYE